MLLRLAQHLEDQTAKEIRKYQLKLGSGEISEEEYEFQYESIMDKYRLETEIIIRQSGFNPI